MVPKLAQTRISPLGLSSAPGSTVAHQQAQWATLHPAIPPLPLPTFSSRLLRALPAVI
eukprot:GDKH01018527.1.p5 GENE.GDKH01018527.1~~GDKH01018527.1.p5  ORF type:complete len:58 (-),score=8.04 GDKH01018527.1:80-253(-)